MRWWGVALLLALAVPAWARSPLSFRGTGAPAPVSGGPQTISSITQFTSASIFQANTANAVVGTVNVTMSPAAPPFGGTLSITGANSCGFHLSGGTQVQAGASGCSVTGGPHSNGLYDDWNVVATQTGVPNSPFSQSEAASAKVTPVPVSITFTPNPVTIADNTAACSTVATLMVNMSDGSTYLGTPTVAACSQSPCPFEIDGSSGNWSVDVTAGVTLVDATNQSFTISAP